MNLYESNFRTFADLPLSSLHKILADLPHLYATELDYLLDWINTGSEVYLPSEYL